MSTINEKRRIFCVGLDGGTWSVLRPLMDAGYMPNLKALTQTGVSGVLDSTVPPITPAAWSTFMTGCNPGKHGIFDFQGYDRQREAPFIVNATNLRVPTLWQNLSDSGLRVAIVDLPMTYPPPRVNGALISGLLTPNRQANFTQPAGLRDEIERHLGYSWPLLQEEEDRGISYADFNSFLELMQRFVRSRGEAMLYLLRREAWDFAFIQFQSVDFLQHPFWKFLDPSHPAYSPAHYQKVAIDFYALLDEMLGKLLTAVDKSMGAATLRVVVSDHGFQRHRTRAELNHWLYENGFLVPQTSPRNSWRYWAEWIRQLDVLQLRKRLLGKTKRMALSRHLNQHGIDRRQSCAWAFSSFWGYLYFGPRITSHDKKRLENLLRAWRDPETGTPIVRCVYEAATIYHGAARDRMPDLIIEPTPGYTFASKTYFHSHKVLIPVEADDFHTGTHAREGIYVLAGPGVRKMKNGHLPPPASLQDMAPTFLHWLEQPIPAHMDGVVQTDWFEAHIRDRVQPPASGSFAISAEQALSETEEQDIKARLHALGYL